MIQCEIKDSCPGCQLWNTPYIEQVEQKKEKLAHLLNLDSQNIIFHTYKEFGLRQRFDFIIKNNQIGLLNKNKDLIPIKKCLQLTPRLQNALDLLQTINFNIKIGTIRIRESHHIDKFGLWLDFANVDIKYLLEEKYILNQLSEHFYIEIGQKRKTLNITENTEQHKLSDPIMRPWFETFDYSTEKKYTVPLFSAISSFTQPSPSTAQIISDLIVNWIKKTQSKEIWEFGCGLGQYSVPIISLNLNLTCFEVDDFALKCLRQTLNNLEHNNKFNLYHGDFHQKNTFDKLNIQSSPDLTLVNPPKSGLKEFANILIETQSKFIIYISCYPESFTYDTAQLQNAGYKLVDVHIVDQFPQTNHFEVAALLQRINM